MRSKVGKSKEADYGTVSNLESIRNASPVSDIPTWIEWCYRIMWALMRCVMPSRPSTPLALAPAFPNVARPTTDQASRAHFCTGRNWSPSNGIERPAVCITQHRRLRNERAGNLRVSVPSRPHAHPKPTQTERRAQALTGMVDGDADGGRVIAIESQHRCLPWLPARGTATSDSQSLIAPYRYNAVRLFRFEAEAIRRRFSLTVCSLSDVQTSCEDPPPQFTHSCEKQHRKYPQQLNFLKSCEFSTHSSSNLEVLQAATSDFARAQLPVRGAVSRNFTAALS